MSCSIALLSLMKRFRPFFSAMPSLRRVLIERETVSLVQPLMQAMS